MSFYFAKLVVGFFGKALIWIAKIYLWLTSAAEGMDNLVTSLIVVAVVVFGPGLWLAKRLREKEEKERAAKELEQACADRQRVWDASHELTPEEEQALSFLNDPGEVPKHQEPDSQSQDELQELRDYFSAMQRRRHGGKKQEVQGPTAPPSTSKPK